MTIPSPTPDPMPSPPTPDPAPPEPDAGARPAFAPGPRAAPDLTPPLLTRRRATTVGAPRPPPRRRSPCPSSRPRARSSSGSPREFDFDAHRRGARDVRRGGARRRSPASPASTSCPTSTCRSSTRAPTSATGRPARTTPRTAGRGRARSPAPPTGRSPASASASRTTSASPASRCSTARRSWRATSRARTRPSSRACSTPAPRSSARPRCPAFCFDGGGLTGYPDPQPTNPHDAAYLCGSSSNGSAAVVVTGQADIALGGDQGGSIRLPASWSGCVGHKPTYGLVPYTGIFPIELTIDHVGPMARTRRRLRRRCSRCSPARTGSIRARSACG